MNPLAGQWLPAKAKILFEGVPFDFSLLLIKQEDKYNVALANREQFDETECEQFYIVPVPYIPVIEPEVEKDEDNAA